MTPSVRGLCPTVGHIRLDGEDGLDDDDKIE